jgi:ABC-2 type transport system ATP-binding protein
MLSDQAISIDGVSHCYTARQALDKITFDVARAEIFGLLGPNGGGKTTLFRLVSTLLSLQQGRISVLGHDVASSPATVRECIGVTFQSPSLDGKLTVRENLIHQGRLYGLYGRRLRSRIDNLLSRLSLADRAADRADLLSGGLKRRVEIAKGLLHEPRLLLLDEPSTGLDPGARLDLWRHLHDLRKETGVTVLVTTHLMEEAERCDRLAIVNQGQVVALGKPGELRAAIGGDCISLSTAEPAQLAAEIARKFSLTPQTLDGKIRIEVPRGHEWLGRLVEAFGSQIDQVALSKPTLEDVFVHHTGKKFTDE